ncbi:MAG: hypothetical protein GY719_25945 [bacterium]|nr:hypothetical protein [bacterium]
MSEDIYLGRIHGAFARGGGAAYQTLSTAGLRYWTPDAQPGRHYAITPYDEAVGPWPVPEAIPLLKQLAGEHGPG